MNRQLFQRLEMRENFEHISIEFITFDNSFRFSHLFAIINNSLSIMQLILFNSKFKTSRHSKRDNSFKTWFILTSNPDDYN